VIATTTMNLHALSAVSSALPDGVRGGERRQRPLAKETKSA
jgi:hypothetical protein